MKYWLPTLALIFTTCGSPTPPAEPADLLPEAASPDTARLPDAAQDTAQPDTPPLDAFPPGPCLHVQPPSMEFGAVQLGDDETRSFNLAGCGDHPAMVTGLTLSDDSDPDFHISFSDDDLPPSPGKPLLLAAGDAIFIHITYTPSHEAEPDDDGIPIFSKATLIIHSDASPAERHVSISGFGVDVPCPKPVITIAEGDEVIPGTIVHLSGLDSYAGGKPINKYEWTVDAPSGGASAFVPGPTDPEPTYLVEVCGEYTFYLTVYDENDIPSCVPAKKSVIVVGDSAIRLELVWYDPFVETQAELDLHLLRYDAPMDAWFDPDYDCWSENPNPDWGVPGIGDDNPAKALPAPGWDGVELVLPFPGLYQAGVHNKGDTDATATFRVYFYSTMVFEIPDVLLTPGDFWSVATIDWPLAEVQAVLDDQGELVITPGE